MKKIIIAGISLFVILVVFLFLLFNDKNDVKNKINNSSEKHMVIDESDIQPLNSLVTLDDTKDANELLISYLLAVDGGYLEENKKTDETIAYILDKANDPSLLLKIMLNNKIKNCNTYPKTSAVIINAVRDKNVKSMYLNLDERSKLIINNLVKQCG